MTKRKDESVKRMCCADYFKELENFVVMGRPQEHGVRAGRVDNVQGDDIASKPHEHEDRQRKHQERNAVKLIRTYTRLSFPED